MPVLPLADGSSVPAPASIASSLVLDEGRDPPGRPARVTSSARTQNGLEVIDSSKLYMFQ